jgi:hypothetical protein
MKKFVFFLVLPIVFIVTYIQFTTPFLFGGDDGYRHIKYSFLLRTVWDGSRDFFLNPIPDTGFLFHLFLVPFTYIDNLIVAAKVADIVLVALLLVMFSFLLYKRNIKYSWFWLLVFVFGSSDFFLRLFLTRTYLLSIIFLLLGFYFLNKKKLIHLFVVAVLYALAYPAAPLLLFLSIVNFLVEYYFLKRFDFRFIAVVFFGLVLGYIVNPSFPQNIIHIWTNILPVLTTVPLNYVSAGQELYGYSLGELFLVNGYIVFIWIISLLGFIKLYKNEFVDSEIDNKLYLTNLIIISFSFFLLMLKSVRFVEYWVPFAVLFVSCFFSVFYEKLVLFCKVHILEKFKLNVPILFLLFFAPVTGLTIDFLLSYGKTAPNPGIYKDGMLWIENNSLKDEVVFNTDWGNFSILYFWDSKNKFVVNVDPTSLYLDNKELYNKWRVVSDDEVSRFGSLRDLYRMMFVDFSSRFVFVEKNRNPRLMEFLDFDFEGRYFERGFEDEGVVVYKLKNK